jgi:hypothetical protein
LRDVAKGKAKGKPKREADLKDENGNGNENSDSQAANTASSTRAHRRVGRVNFLTCCHEGVFEASRCCLAVIAPVREDNESREGRKCFLRSSSRKNNQNLHNDYINEHFAADFAPAYHECWLEGRELRFPLSWSLRTD